jgi:flagellar hook-associated protein 1 FlgK
MSIDAVLNTAVTGLNVAQSALQTVSNNIANVNTPGFTRKVVELESIAAGGVGGGVQVADVKRIVDEFLQQSVRGASSDASQSSTTLQLQNQLQAVLGDPSKATSLSGQLDTLMTGLAALPNDPTSSANRITAVTGIQEFGSALSQLALQVQTLRGSADQQIQQNVSSANTDLQSVFTLNSEIQKASLSGQDTNALQDQRDQALTDLAKIMDVRTFTLSSGGVGVSTTSGVTLVDDSEHQLVYNAPGSLASNTIFPQITVNRQNSITGAIDPTGTPLDSQVRSGSLRGLLDMRDTFLPNLAQQLGQLGGSVADQLNAVHNANTTVPPPASMTGRNTGLTTTDLQGFTGTTTFDVFDANNNIVSSASVNFSSLPAGATLNTVINQVNTALGANGSLSLVNGVMTFTAGPAAGAVGVAIQDGAPPSSRGGRGFSQFFGMNDLVQAAAYSNYDSGLAASSLQGFTGQTTLQFVGPNNNVTQPSTLDFNSAPLSAPGATVSDVLNQLNSSSSLSNVATFSLNANGALVVTPKAGFSGYRLEVNNDSSNRAGTGVNFSSFFGVGSHFGADRASNFAVRGDIAANPALLSLGQVNAGGTPALTVGDTRGSLALQALAQKTVKIPAAGGTAAANTTLNTYAAQILAGVGQAAAQVQTQSNDQQALQTELQSRSNSVSGVNLDEELANMVTFQNAYNASARIITTAQQLFTTLMQM